MADLRQMLQSSLWAHTLSPEELARVCAESHEEYVRAGTHVARIGDEARHWLGVSEGVLIMSVCSEEGKESTFTGVTNGGWFGEGSLLKDGPWRYNAIAARDSRIVWVPRDTFRRLVQTSLPFNHFLLTHLNARLGLFISLVEYDRLLGPDARVARCLASACSTLTSIRKPAASSNSVRKKLVICRGCRASARTRLCNCSKKWVCCRLNSAACR